MPPSHAQLPTLRENAAKRSRAPKSRLSRTRKPEDMTLEAWQTALRRQFGREQKFKLVNLGRQPVFSDFAVTNPQTRRTYRVAIRGNGLGDNFCTCPDFVTNTLGTCKHIEFTLARLRRSRAGRNALKAGHHPPYSEVYLQYGAQRIVRIRIGTECPPDLRALIGEYFDDGVLRPEAFATFNQFLSATGRFEHELRCHDDVLSFIAEVRDRDRRRRLIDAAFPRGIHSPALDTLLKARLYDYQKQGALFAARAGRCLIGDEMGLGKTIQAIAAAQIMAEHLGVQRVLIICPTSLKHQWEREIARFSGRSAQVIGGLRPRRQMAFAAESFFKITNYDTVHRDLDLIQGWSPELVILDEAQRIKNWNTLAARSVKQIDSPYAIVLTGTPLENRLEELVSIVQFVDQHRLGPTFRFLAEHQIHDEVGRVVGYRNLDSIGRTLEPLLLRRKKSQVLSQLPPRLDKNFFVPMTPQQMTHHEENREIVAKIVHKWRRRGFLTESDQRRLTIALQLMRMSCDSTYLLDQETDFGVKADELITLLGEMYERPGTKVVIFSQWVRMHELLVRRLEKRRWDHVLFHGGVESFKRKALIDRFREDQRCRAFLSTDAGGVGLNLQHASAVVNMDLPWNPAVLEQRIGRVHRLGQSQPVQVVNFVSQGTIEHGMLSVLKFKKSLFAGVLDGGEKEVFLGGSRLKKFMESVENATGAIPQATVEEPEEPEEGEEAEAPKTRGRRAGARPGADGEPEPPRPPHAPGAPATPAADPWAALLTTGLTILEQLAAAARPGAAESAASARGGLSLVHRDPQTGETFLRLPMPSPEVLDRALGAIATVLAQFRR